MKIKRLLPIRIPHAWKTRVFVVAEGEDGTLGIGEATVGNLSASVLGAIQDVSPLILGGDSHDLHRLQMLAARDIYADGGQILTSALGGIDIALSDMNAKAAGVPLHQTIGGLARTKIKAYANGWYRTDRKPEAIALLAKAAVRKGYRALKIDPFGANWRTLPRKEFDLSLAVLSAVREAVGMEVDVLVEAHSRFDISTAIKIARAIEPIAPLWFEEPIPHWDIDGYARLVSGSGVPIASGESLWRLDQFVDLMKVAKVPIIQFDPTHVGGIGMSRTISALALASNASIAPHSASSVVNQTVCAHFCLSSPHALILERFQDFETDLGAEERISSPARFSDGFVSLESRPGLGCEFDLNELLRLHDADAVADDMSVFREAWEKRGSR